MRSADSSSKIREAARLKRILLVTGVLSPIGGVSNQVANLALSLHKLGIRVMVLVKDPIRKPNQHFDALRRGKVPVISIGSWVLPICRATGYALERVACLLAPVLPRGSRLTLRRWLSAKALWMRLWHRALAAIERAFGRAVRVCALISRAQIVHVFRPDDVAAAAIDAATDLSIPTVFSDTGEALPSIPLYTSDLLRAARRSDAVIVMSQRVAENERRIYGPSVKVEVIPPVVELRGPARSTPARHKITLAYAGRLTPEKNLDGLLLALGGLGTDVVPWRLIVAGAGPELDRCREIAKQMGISDRVEFRGPYRYERGFLKLAGEVDLFVVPSHTEGYGLILLEAAAAGRPVVATPVGAALEIVQDGKTGFLGASSRPEDLREALLRALKERSTLAAMGRAARRAYEKTYSHSAALDATMRCYGSVLLKSVPIWPHI